MYLSNRNKLPDWKEEFSYDKEAITRVEEFMGSANYAAEILGFHEINSISLKRLREEVDDFVVPQMYYFLEGRELIESLEKIFKRQEI